MRLLALAVGAFIGLACSAKASVVYSVSGDFTVFNGSGVDALSEDFTSGLDTFSLTYTISPGAANNTVSSFPSNENLGVLMLACTAGCDGATVDFPSFTFVITIDDTTDGGMGTFVGTSAGGNVSYNSVSQLGSSAVDISWSPLQLGPNAQAATSGSFGTTFFTINSTSGIVDPSTNHGATTIQGTISSTLVPEPAAFGMLGAGLMGLGIIARKRKR